MNYLLLALGCLFALVLGAFVRIYLSDDGKPKQKKKEKEAGLATVIIQQLFSFRAKLFYTSIVGSIVALGVLYISWIYAGAIATILYLIVFLGMATLFPVIIGVFGNAMLGSAAIGKLHLILGAFSYGNMVLVQFEDKFDLCPATDDQVYIDGVWYDIEGGQTNWSILGWRPFGILRFKDDETLRNARVDTKALRGRETSTDGGTVSRGGYAEGDVPLDTGIDGTWVIDLKRVFSRGVKRIGDINLIETAEEIMARKHAEEGLVSGLESILAPVVGIIIGVAVGYMLLGGV